ncbi:MAG: hypothetical protein RLZZ536_1353 [Planctomycetota bacterium]
MDFVLLGLFSALVVFRNSSGLNYGELHIGLSERVPVTGLRVYCTTADGRLQAFSAREENPRYFSQILCTGAIQSLHISVPANVVLSAEDIEVRFGENWGRPSRRLQFNLAETRPVVADAGPRQVFEVIPQRVRQSWFARPGSCNWQGDFWLLIVPLVQSAVIVGIGLLLRRLWALNAASALPMMHTWGTRKFSFRSLGFVSWGFSAVRVFLLLLMSWQILTLAPGFLFVRWGDQFVAAVLMLCVLCGVLGLYVRFILTRSSDLQRLWVCAALVAIVFIVKLSFCLSFDGVQQGDYEKYYRYGMAIASGRWDLIGDSGVLTRGIFLERSAVFTAPLIWLFGPSLTGLELSLLVMEFGTVVGMVWLTTRMFGVSAACCSVPFLLVYPPFIFSTWVVGTTTPGFLWMVILWCAAEKLVEYFRGMLSVQPGRPGVWCWLLSCIVFCGALVMLDLTRMFALFVYAAACVSGLVALLSLGCGAPRPSVKQVSGVFLIGGLTLYLGSAGVRAGRGVIREEIREQIVNLPTASMLDAVSAMDSTTDGSGVTISNWRFATLLNTPPRVRSELIRRKLLHEKLLTGHDAWFHIFRKNAYLSFVHDAQIRVLGGMTGTKEGFMAWSRVPWYTTLRLFTDGVSLMLLCFGLLRCLNPGHLGVTRAELFPLSFVVILYSAIVVLLEAGPYYSYIVAFPLAWSAGLVLGRKRVNADVGAADSVPTGSFLSALQWNRPAIVVCAALVLFGVHVLGAKLLQDTGLGFLAITAAEGSEVPGGKGLLSRSRVHVAVALPATAGVVPAGRECAAEFVVPGAFRNSDRCCFLLTVDARSRNLYFPRSFWKSLPVEYVVEWNGREYQSGGLGSLHPPQMFCIDASEAEGERPVDLRLRVRLRAVGEVNVRESGFLPAIAVEYPFNPDGDPRSELQSWRENVRKAEQAEIRSGQ